MYFLATNELEASNVLNMIVAADMPYMKKDDRKKIHTQLKGLLPRAENDSEPISLEQLGAMIARGVK